MAEETNIRNVIADRVMLRGLDLFDRELSHQISTSQRFTEGCSISHLEQQREFVEYSTKEAKADVESLTGYSQGSQMHDIARYQNAMDTVFANSGQKYRYASNNPPAPVNP